jgi:hypothetical protein
LQSSGAFRYTTALAPALAAGALAALHLMTGGQALLERAARWRDGLAAAGWPRPAGQGPILALLVGSDARALALQRQLEATGLLCVAIRPPTVLKSLFILACMALSVAMSNKPRPKPDWLLATTTCQPAWLRRAMASRAPGNGIHSSGDLMKSSLSWLMVPSRSKMTSLLFMV